jgi:hypothetical protein
VAVYFVCSCGQDLGASEKQVGKEIPCPACGRHVLVPPPQLRKFRFSSSPFPLFETSVQAAAPRSRHSLKTRQKAGAKANEREPVAIPAAPKEPGVSPVGAGADEASAAYPVLPEPADGGVEEFQQAVQMEEARRLLARAEADLAECRARTFPWQRERYWLQCLLYPLRAVFLLFGLAVAWAVLTTFLVATLPDTWDAAEVTPRLPLLMPLGLLLGYTFAAFRCTLVSAARGEAGFIAWPGFDLAQTAWSGLVGLVCFLTGPIVPAVVAYLFWLESGDLTWVDELILWELATLTVAGWALAMLAAHGGGKLRYATLGAAAKLVHKLGYRLLGIALIGAAVATFVGLRALGALADLQEGLEGWLILIGWWTGTLCGLVFLLRWLGVSCFRARKLRAQRRRQERNNKEWDRLAAAASPRP